MQCFVDCHWVTSTCLKAQCKRVCCSQPRSVLLGIGFVCVPACLLQLPTTEKEDENAEAGGDGGEEEEEPQREEVTEVSSLGHTVYEDNHLNGVWNANLYNKVER